MDKIKLEIKPIENKIIKIGKQKVEIRPYISAQDIQVATNMCLEQFFKNVDKTTDKYELFPQVRIAFDTLILETCTNIDYDGMLYDEIISCGIMENIRKHIFNYNEVFELVLESIRLKNVEVSLGIIANTLPNEKEMENTMTGVSQMIKDLNDKDPTLFRKMVETSAMSSIVEKTRNEFAEDKAKIKEEKLAQVKKINKKKK